MALTYVRVVDEFITAEEDADPPAGTVEFLPTIPVQDPVGNVVIAQVPNASANAVTRLMERPGLVDIRRQADSWRNSGWKAFDPNQEVAVPGRRL